ncbi:hypothetical protein BC826DRAFT_1088245 [Russula brevipes]|nr:hypothetical protein BC826DRAFT_1088245 [Russula brevipes]
MSLDGCTTLDWDTRSFLSTRSCPRIPAAGRATYGHPARASILLCVCLDGDNYHWHDDAAPSAPGPAWVLSLGATKRVKLFMATAAEELHSHHHPSHIVARKKHNRSLDVGFGFRCVAIVMVDAPSLAEVFWSWQEPSKSSDCAPASCVPSPSFGSSGSTG